MRHCKNEAVMAIQHDEDLSARKHLIGLLAIASPPDTLEPPLLIDSYTDLVSSMSVSIKPVSWQEVKSA